MTELNELFADVAEDIQRSIRDLGWSSPTPVQAAAIPKMRAGGDLIVQAQTGSGKTGAFGIPLVEAIETDLAETQAIVLLPTRELANQVAVELDALGRYRGVRTLPIYGGVAYGPQLEGLEKGAHIIVGTPGRILDHLKNGRMDLDRTKVLVLDEADEMLSLGFWPDMKEIASYLPRKRQSHLFSATMPEKVRSLSRFFLTDPEDVTIDDDGANPQQIEHYYYVCAASEKEATLARILQYEDPESAIIFCNTKADVRFITAYLAKRGFNIDQISGDLQQSAREKAIAKIKAGKLRFLVATDVAARGIDISDLSAVINYTTSDSPEVYVHRTGRTGRAGKSGVAISLVSGLDIGNFKFMQTVSGIEVIEKKVPTERQLTRRLEKRAKERAEKAKSAPAEPEPVEDDTASAEPEEAEETQVASPTETPAPTESPTADAAKAPEARQEREPKKERAEAERGEESAQEPDLLQQLADRADRALDGLSDEDRTERVESLLPIVTELAEDEAGRQKLAEIAAGLLSSRPRARRRRSSGDTAEASSESRADNASGERSEGRPRRRGGRRGGSGARSGGGSGGSGGSGSSESGGGRAREGGSDDRPRRRRRRS